MKLTLRDYQKECIMNSTLEKEHVHGNLEIVLQYDSKIINEDSLEVLSQYEPHIDASVFPSDGFISIETFRGTTKNFYNFVHSLHTLHNSTDANISGTGVIRTYDSIATVSFNSGNYEITSGKIH